MSYSILDPTTVAVVGVSLLGLYRLAQIGHREANLPPGPPTVPLLGNLHVFPKRSAHYQFAKWGRQYGDVFSLKLAHKTAVVISSASAIRDIMEKNSALTADRPHFHMAEIITSGGKNMVVSGYNENWKKLRRGAREILTPQACARHLPLQQAEAAQLMHDILTHPSEFSTSVRRFSFSVILSIMFGKRAPQFSTPEVTAFYHAIHLWEEVLEPGAHPPVDLIPILKKVPERFAPWKTLCKEVQRLQIDLYFGLLKEAEERMKRGEANGCWMEEVLERASEWDMDRSLVGHLGGTLIEAAADTTASFLLTFILLMVAFPEAQKRAQEEIVRVVGMGHAPSPDDFQRLPYVQALIKETHRFRPAAPLLFPHSSTGDIAYKGYCIPSGTTIFVNNWAVSHDDQAYEDEAAFNPDRFLKNKFGVREEVAPMTGDWKDDLVFGVGRRACPGIHFAKSSIAINVVNLLWAFNFNKAKDPETGKEIEPDLWDYTTGVMSYPNPFKCTITPRSTRHAEIIRQEYQAATEVFLPFEHELSADDRYFVKRERSGVDVRF